MKNTDFKKMFNSLGLVVAIILLIFFAGLLLFSLIWIFAW